MGDAQDKRSVIPIEMDDVDYWLSGSAEEASSLLRLALEHIFDAAPLLTTSQVRACVVIQQSLW
ncbi:hypothetical protein GCM10010096_11710 [Alcaligenes pakistanensis]|uniref:Uncharacterized protein n=1 Tax=Alcaligenes pakistanensis TaxID=1482717 RepID=A0A8H9M4Q4_9BURK|nr:hypothetical protein GCM10010096_11710 [Alcaligenes pakistanensis]